MSTLKVNRGKAALPRMASAATATLWQDELRLEPTRIVRTLATAEGGFYEIWESRSLPFLHRETSTGAEETRNLFLHIMIVYGSRISAMALRIWEGTDGMRTLVLRMPSVGAGAEIRSYATSPPTGQPSQCASAVFHSS